MLLCCLGQGTTFVHRLRYFRSMLPVYVLGSHLQLFLFQVLGGGHLGESSGIG